MRHSLAAACLLGIALAAPGASGRTGSVIRVEHRDPTALPTRGPADALVTIELFFTPGAVGLGGSSTSQYRMIEKLQADHPTRIRLIYRIVPGPTSRLHYAALEAHAEGKYFEFIDALHRYQATHGSQMPNDAQLAEIAEAAGVDSQRLIAVTQHPPESYEKLIGPNGENERRRKRKFNNGAIAALFNGRPMEVPLSSTSTSQQVLEAEYERAKDLALDLIDRGADPRHLVEASELAQDPPPEPRIMSDSVDEEICEPPAPGSSIPPLDLSGMPSYGPPNAETTIAILCSPTSFACRNPVLAGATVQALFPDSVRLVWAPLFDVAREDAADLAMLGDAALCAEKVGAQDDRPDAFDARASAGWLWVQVVREEVNRRRRLPTEKVIDRVAERLHVDRIAFARCRAQLAGTTVTWIEQARRARACTVPGMVVGGRVYPALSKDALQTLVEGELAPGLLGSIPTAGSAVR